jgi:hypothetical protein
MAEASGVVELEYEEELQFIERRTLSGRQGAT